MSLRKQAQQIEQQFQGEPTNRVTNQAAASGVTTPISTFNDPRPYGIHDGELVEVMGITPDWPGKSPVYWCRSDDDGSSAPLSFLEVQVYSNLAAATQALRQQRAPVGGGRPIR